MALTQFTEDLNIISALDDRPNDNDGLSATEVKYDFDLAGLLIQTYINTVLIPEVEAAIEAAALGITQNGISTEYINDGAVTEDKLSSVAGLEAVVSKTIRNGAVTREKLSSALQELLTTYGNSITNLATTTTAQGNSISNLQTSLSNLSTTVSGKQAQHKTAMALLNSGLTTWTVIVAGVKPNNTVIVTPDADSFNEFVDTGVRCTAQGEGTFSFASYSATENNLTGNILIFD